MSSVQVSKELLFYVLVHRPKVLPTIDVEIIQKAPTHVKTNPRQFSCICNCYHPVALTQCEGDLLSVKANPKLHSMNLTFLVDEWLQTNVWIVQCPNCGQIYWS